MYIRGNDNGTPVNAITLDMSEAGAATFAGGITSTAVANTLGATSFNEANITNVGNIALDSITADGSTITITGNTTFADGAYNFNIASHDGSNGLQLGGTLVTATAAELNIIDGGTSASSTTVADADRVVFNDDGTMKQIAVTDLNTYLGSATSIDGLSDAKSEGSNFTGSLLIGHETTGTLNDSYYNTGVGLRALESLTNGDWNTAIGYWALSSNTMGEYNTASGGKALYYNTTGDKNTANGYYALYSNTTGDYNTASGSAAL